MMMRAWCLSVILFLAAPLSAEEVVIYRCTDASGHLTIQNSPCPKGSRSEKKVMQPIATVPMAAPAPSTRVLPPPAPSPIAAPAATSANASTTHSASETQRDDDRPRLPPPPVFQCTTYDRDTYITESDQPQQRCIPLQTVGLDGNPRNGAGQACDMVYDQCVRVPDGGLCAAWQKRLGETEVAWRFGRSDNLERNRQEFERVQRIVNESACSE